MPGRGELDPPADPIEERGTEVGLQLFDGQGEGRLGDERRLGRRGEAAVVHDGHEVLEATGIHLHSLSI